mgnify:FL=1
MVRGDYGGVKVLFAPLFFILVPTTNPDISEIMPTIEELIKQPKFRNEKHKATVSVLYVHNLITNYFEEYLGKYGLTLQQFNVLRILRGQQPNPSTINLIRERMLDKMSDASRIVERLRKAELVDRLQSKEDRRAVDVVITAKGLRVLSEIDKNSAQLDRPFEKLSEQEAAQLSKLIEKVFDTLV